MKHSTATIVIASMVIAAVVTAIVACSSSAYDSPKSSHPSQSDSPATHSPRDTSPGSNEHLAGVPAEFTVYEHVRFYKDAGPGVAALGFPRMPMIHNKDVRAEPDGDWLEVSPANVVDAIDRLELDCDYGGPIVIDYEPYVKVWDDTRTVNAWLEVIATVREQLPKARVAVFGLPTVRYRAAIDGQRKPISVDQVREVLEAVDFIAPQIYADSDQWNSAVEQRTRKHMDEALSVGKPVIPFIRPRTTGNTGDRWMEIDVVLSRIATIREMGASGVIVWDRVEIDPADRAEQDRRQTRVFESIREWFDNTGSGNNSDAR